jgi:hypothetical protein
MNLKFALPAILLFLLIFNAAASANSLRPVSGDPPQVGTNQVQTITETMKVVKTELSTNTIVVSNSYIHTFIIDPSAIDLRRFQVGEKVTATLQVTTTIDRITKARISKTQLVKLVKQGLTP